MRKWVSRLVSNQEIATTLSTAVGVYFTLYGTFPQWHYFKDYPLINKIAFITFSILIIVIPLAKYYCGKSELVELRNANRTLTAFHEALYKIVSKKIVHFKSIAKQLKNGKTFEQVTTPEERIQTIFEEASEFITKSYGIDKDDLDITILSKGQDGAWSFFKKHHTDWKHRNANDLFAQNSSAFLSIQKGETSFFPSKLEASKRGEYTLGERDNKSNGSGSIFVCPVGVECPSRIYEYLISIVTYSTPLAPETDINARDSAKVYLEQIAKRIELELCLRSIKHFRQTKPLKPLSNHYEPVPRKSGIII